MVFSSTIFLFAFLPVTLLGYYLLDRRFKNMFLLLMSLIFYAWGEPRFVFVMMGSILMNYVFGLLVVYRKGKLYQRTVLALMIFSNCAIFFVFKYLNFTIQNLNTLFNAEIPQTNIALPIGISFFTFQAMSYVFDVYRSNGEVQKNPFNVALYISFFPQLVAGPIVRYETVANEIRSRKETLKDFAEGTRRFAIGLGKKVILANSVAIIADQAFAYTNFSELSVLTAWLGALAYTFQIYFDFSGYSDMAIGLGLMFGFHFDENFNYPYISGSITEFWRRWHISLSTWFRDYVYIPLGGSRVGGRYRHIFNLFVVWLLTGFWHGAAWHYVAWGLFYFVLLVFEKTANLPKRLTSSGARYTYRALTLLCVVIGWVLFRANGLKNGLKYIGCMFGLMGNTLVDPVGTYLVQLHWPLLGITVLCSVPLAKYLGKRYHHLTEYLSPIFSIGLLIISVAFTVTTTYNPFIYFNF